MTSATARARVSGMTARHRIFLFLQGPHGPFFAGLARALTRAGASCRRIAVNRADRVMWAGAGPLSRFTGDPADWPAYLDDELAGHGVTDLVLYGDTRPVHAQAMAAARGRGVTVHVFEEGYLRPWWITYERGGANGHSPLLDLGLDDMARFLARSALEPVEAPAHWGAIRRHAAWGAAYHAILLTGGAAFPSHRTPSIWAETLLNLRRFALGPVTALDRALATRRLHAAATPYHLVLLQLDHDASFRAHGDFPDTPAFVDAVARGFAAGAMPHHRLVFKAHPLEDGRIPLARLVRETTHRHGIAARTHFIAGGKLGPLLDLATSAVTVNSTGAQQALFRGLPVRAFGRSVYCRPEFVSDQPLPEFFETPRPPDRAAYGVFRQFLLETSQLPGAFYSARGRAQLYRRLPDIMLAKAGRYARTAAAERQHLHTLPASGSH